ncbi:MAG: NlpC/P60 family protein [Verrucomicrobiales bacterium]|nr:NlpC/P60 family protein [Verrucomicrobiales bacterium]
MITRPFASLFAAIILLFSSDLTAQPAAVSSIKPSDLVEYEQQPEAVKNLIRVSLGLTKKNLAYTYGSDSPAKGGMDCSGTVSCALRLAGVKSVPRSSYTIYHWANDRKHLTRLNHVYSPNHPTLRLMKPGDLVFWEGTYSVKDRNPPISHVMIYLGTLKKDGQGVLFGASSGRRFRGKKIHGVSVFDFRVPSKTSKAKLVAFGPVPGVRSPQKSATVEKAEEPEKPLGNLRKVFSNKKNNPTSGSSN